MRRLKIVLYIFAMTLSVTAQAVTITKLSNSTGGADANAASVNPSISDDGRYVVFESTASNLVANDNNLSSDIFLVDTANGAIERISQTASGLDANGASNNPAISGNGQYIVFESFASNLVANDSNRVIDIFMYDRVAGAMERISVDSAGVQGNSHSFSPSVSADGQVVAFYSMSTNLATGDGNRAIDVFVRDRSAGVTDIVSVDSGGNPANMASWQPVVSANGQYVAFSSNATNLVSGDINNAQDVFLYDRMDGSITMISRTADGTPANGLSGYPAISANGEYVVFESDATDLAVNDTNGLTDIFAADIQLSTVTRISTTVEGLDSNAPSYQPRISRDGRFITYYSYASNIVAPDLNDVEDVFIYDQVTGIKEILTRTMNGDQSNASSFTAALSADGRYVATSTLASNLDPMDTNDLDDVYLFDRGIVNTPPVANAGNDLDIVLGTAATLDGSASSDPDGDAIVSYQWQLTSAPAASGLSGWTSADVAPVFLPDTDGTYVISLIVGDGIAQSAADDIFINVSQNLPPTAVATADVTQGYIPLTVNFDGSQSMDPEGATLQFNWEFGDGAMSSEVSPIHVYTSAGNYNAVLSVTDNLGNTAQAIVRISVLSINQPPVISNLSVSPVSGVAPLTVTLSIAAMDADNDALTISWDLGDGTIINNVTSFSHVYLSAGIYTGSVTVSDGVNSASESFVVNAGSGFKIKDTHIKMQINHRKPQRSKFKSWSSFEIDRLPTADDQVALLLNDLEIMRMPFNQFQEIRSGLYVYKDRQLFVKLDFNESQLHVLKRRFLIAEPELESSSNIRLQLGDLNAVDDVVLHSNKHCQKHRYGNRDGGDCPVTTIKTVNTNDYTRHDHDH